MGDRAHMGARPLIYLQMGAASSSYTLWGKAGGVSSSELCFAAPVPQGQEERVAVWLASLRSPDPARDQVLRAAGIRLGRSYVQTVRDQPLAVVSFGVVDPERAFSVLDRSTEPWTRSFWSFLQRAEAYHPEPVSPLDRLLADAAPAWQSLRDDLVHR